MKNTSLFIMGILTSTFMGCVGDVRPGADGINSVLIITDDKATGQRSALRQAKRWCKKEDQSFVVHEEIVSFVCDMDEADYVRAKQLAAAAQAAGSVTSANAEEESNAETVGDILQASGAAAEAALGECYEIELLFECIP